MGPSYLLGVLLALFSCALGDAFADTAASLATQKPTSDQAPTSLWSERKAEKKAEKEKEKLEKKAGKKAKKGWGSKEAKKEYKHNKHAAENAERIKRGELPHHHELPGGIMPPQPPDADPMKAYTDCVEQALARIRYKKAEQQKHIQKDQQRIANGEPPLHTMKEYSKEYDHDPKLEPRRICGDPPSFETAVGATISHNSLANLFSATAAGLVAGVLAGVSVLIGAARCSRRAASERADDYSELP